MRNKNNWSADTSTANWKGGILAIWVSKNGTTVGSAPWESPYPQLPHVVDVSNTISKFLWHYLPWFRLCVTFTFPINVCISLIYIYTSYHINIIISIHSTFSIQPTLSFSREPPPHGGAYLALPWHLGPAKGEFPPGSTMEAWLDFWGSLGGSGFLGVKVAWFFTRNKMKDFWMMKVNFLSGDSFIYFFKKSCAL